MLTIIQTCRTLLRDRRGATAVEYALILAVFGVLVAAGARLLTGSMSGAAAGYAAEMANEAPTTALPTPPSETPAG